jgi:predicted lipase
MPMDVQRALNLGQFVRAAENPATENPLAYSIPFGYQLVNTIYGNDLATDIGGVKDIVPFGFIAKAPAPAIDFVVAIRGTASIWEWIQDARYNKVTCPFAQGAGQTEDGFTDVYMSLVVDAGGAIPRLVDVLKALIIATPGATLTITGHSLGAALATLLALDVTQSGAFATPSVVTFASPLVGDAQFTLTFNTEVPDSWRIANRVDLIPKLPPVFWGYDDVNQLFPVNSFGKVKLLPACAHHLTTYLFLLSQLGPGGNFPVDADCKM